MSFLVAGLVFKARVKTGPKVASTDKLVLLAMADTANDEGVCWPGLATLADKCELSEDSVRRSIQRLATHGFVTIKPRFDVTGRQTSNGYRISLESLGKSNAVSQSLTESRVGSHDATHPHLPSHDAPPRGLHDAPPLNLSEEPINGVKGEERVLPDWLPREQWDALVEHRKKIKKPMTEYAADLAIKNLTKLHGEGNDPKQVIEQTILNNWTGLFPVKDRQSFAPKHYQKGSKHETRKDIADEIHRRANGLGPVRDGGSAAANDQNTIEGVAARVG